MSKFVRFCLCVNFLAICFAADVCALEYHYDIDSVNLSADTVIENYAHIDDIYTNANNLQIYNYGNIGVIHNSGAAYVWQYIPDNSALNKINLDGSTFRINITNVNSVDLLTLKNVVFDADGIIDITNSSIVINDFADWRNWNQDVSLHGTNTLYINNVLTVVSGERILHIHDNSTKVILTDADKLHKVSLKYDSVSDVAFIYVARETDYFKVFNDNRGVLLNNLRLSGSDNNLLMALDNAQNMSELNDVMQKSYHFNQSVLMRPVKKLNNFSMMQKLSGIDDVYGGFSGFYAFSDTTNMYGINFDINEKYDDIYFGLNFNLNKFKYVDDMNNFSGFVYGGNIKIKKYINDWWMHALGGLSLAKFNANAIYHDNNIENNPFGYSLYGSLDLGHDYKSSFDLILSPFIGLIASQSNVVDVSDTDINIRGGGNIQYSFVMDNVKYEYSGMVGACVNGDMFGSLKVGFVSQLDNAGMALNFDIYKDEYDINYKFSVNGRILF